MRRRNCSRNGRRSPNSSPAMETWAERNPYPLPLGEGRVRVSGFAETCASPGVSRRPLPEAEGLKSEWQIHNHCRQGFLVADHFNLAAGTICRSGNESERDRLVESGREQRGG